MINISTENSNLKKNNFNLLRLLFAYFVIITHSYSLAGIAENDFVFQLTNGQVKLSYLGVRGFFIISGYLIFKSLIRSNNILDYFLKRILRLFPALIIALIVTILFVPFIYQSNIPLVNNSEYWLYLPHNLSLFWLQHNITGVFNNNPGSRHINGSLWTISYEFFLYIVLSFIYIFKKQLYLLKIILISSFGITSISFVFFIDNISKIGILNIGGGDFAYLCAFFVAGSILAIFNLNKKNNNFLLISGTILLIISIYFNQFNSFQFISLPLIVIPIGLKCNEYSWNILHKLGDISYGLYIYSFPIQQSLVYYFNLNYLSLMVLTVIIATIFGYISWHAIEKRALLYKKYI